MNATIHNRHARACRGHPGLSDLSASKTWMAGELGLDRVRQHYCSQVGQARLVMTSPAMTNGGATVRPTIYSLRNITSASTKPRDGCLNAPGKRPTILKPQLCQSFTAPLFVLTTKLNCIAENPISRARSSECRHIARAIPLPRAAGAVT